MWFISLIGLINGKKHALYFANPVLWADNFFLLLATVKKKEMALCLTFPIWNLSLLRLEAQPISLLLQSNAAKNEMNNLIDMPYFDMLCLLVTIVVDFYGDQVCDTTYRGHGKCG